MSKNLSVGGLPSHITDDTLKQLLGLYGAVESVQMLPAIPGLQHKSAVVVMVDASGATMLQQLNGQVPLGLSDPVTIEPLSGAGAGAGAAASTAPKPGPMAGLAGLGGMSGGLAAYAAMLQQAQQAVPAASPSFGSGGTEGNRKTILCKYWTEGRCNKPSEDCTFAHGEVEMPGGASQFGASLSSGAAAGAPVLDAAALLQLYAGYGLGGGGAAAAPSYDSETQQVFQVGKRMNGKITKWDSDRGFGFIASDNWGPDVFVHIKEVLGGQTMLKSLAAGSRVSFEATEDYGKGPGRYKATWCEEIAGGTVIDERTDNLFITGLPIGMREAEVWKVFGQYQGVQGVKMLPVRPEKRDACCFLRMDSIPNAEVLVKEVSGTAPPGMVTTIKITYSENKWQNQKQKKSTEVKSVAGWAMGPY